LPGRLAVACIERAAAGLPRHLGLSAHDDDPLAAALGDHHASVIFRKPLLAE